MGYFLRYVDKVASILRETLVTDRAGAPLTPEEGIIQWCALTKKLQQTKGTMYFIGNGASAMMASHMAADASKNGGLRSLAFNDVALMSAVSNDIAYQECFALPLKCFARAEDLLVTISSSGNSPNIIRAAKVARELDLGVITLSGMNPDNKSRGLGDLNFYVAAETYGVVESSHQLLLHCWLDRFMERN